MLLVVRSTPLGYSAPPRNPHRQTGGRERRAGRRPRRCVRSPVEAAGTIGSPGKSGKKINILYVYIYILSIIYLYPFFYASFRICALSQVLVTCGFLWCISRAISGAFSCAQPRALFKSTCGCLCRSVESHMQNQFKKCTLRHSLGHFFVPFLFPAISCAIHNLSNPHCTEHDTRSNTKKS